MPLNLFSVVVLLVLGLVLGSFGSVIVTRIPRGKGIGGRSVTPCCKKRIAARDLVPVFSFIFLRGRCRGCRRAISLRYPFLEIVSGILLVFPSFHEGYIDPYTVTMGIALWLFLLLATMDKDSQLIPDAVTFPFLGAAVFTAYLRGEIHWLAPLLGGGFFSMQWILSRGRVLGSGDILIGIAMGLLLGTWQETLVGIGLSYIIGAVVVSVLLVMRKAKRSDRVAFVPYLFAGTMVALVVGERLMHTIT